MEDKKKKKKSKQKETKGRKRGKIKEREGSIGNVKEEPKKKNKETDERMK